MAPTHAAAAAAAPARSAAVSVRMRALWACGGERDLVARDGNRGVLERVLSRIRRRVKRLEVVVEAHPAHSALQSTVHMLMPSALF